MMKELAENFKQARIRANITQRELAEMADVMQCTVSRFESGKQGITLETAIKIAKKIGDKKLLKAVEQSIHKQLQDA